jgi:hypothetical protein
MNRFNLGGYCYRMAPVLALDGCLTSRRTYAGMDPLTDKLECWLVWERAPDAETGGRPYLRAVDLTSEQAERHKLAVLDEARLAGRQTMVQIEQSWVNHLYGETMTVGYDSLRSRLKELRDSAKGG